MLWFRHSMKECLQPVSPITFCVREKYYLLSIQPLSLQPLSVLEKILLAVSPTTFCVRHVWECTGFYANKETKTEDKANVADIIAWLHWLLQQNNSARHRKCQNNTSRLLTMYSSICWSRKQKHVRYVYKTWKYLHGNCGIQTSSFIKSQSMCLQPFSHLETCKKCEGFTTEKQNKTWWEGHKCNPQNQTERDHTNDERESYVSIWATVSRA